MGFNIIHLTDNKELVLGFDDSNSIWFIVNSIDNQKVPFNDLKNISPLLGILKEDPDLFFENLKRILNNRNIFITAERNFPLKDILTFCINNKMHYWLNLSIRWHKYIEMDEAFQLLIEGVINDKNYPQNIRHALVKYLNKKLKD